ncbi:MAG: hypothetical protein R2797_03250 [Gelidibacter sp.]
MIKKYSLVVVAFLCFVLSGFGQVAITPIRTDVAGFGTWTDTDVAGTTYLQLLRATSSTITPAMNFNTYTNETLDFTARTFGGVDTAENTVTVSISTDDGGTWTVLGTRTPANNTLTAQAQFDLSSYNGTQVRIRFTVAGTNNGIGIGIDEIAIRGVLPVNLVDWCNLQFPQVGNTTVGTVFNVYAQVREAGVTNLPGGDPNISAWIGYNTANTNPNTWTNWIPATFNTQVNATDDEYVANIGTLPTLPSGTYYYASRFQYNGSGFRYGGYNTGGGNGFWDTTVDISGVLSVDTVDFCNLQFPGVGSITLGDAFGVYGQVYEQGVTPGVGQGLNIMAEIGYSTSNTNPNTWTNWIPTTYNAACSDCNVVAGIPQNDEYLGELGAAITSPGTYYYATRFTLNGGVYLYGGIAPDGLSGGLWNNSSYISGVLTVANVPQCHTEDFTNIPTSSSAYTTRTWTGTGGTWTATDARTDQTITGPAITVRNGSLTSPQFTDGIGSLTVTTQLKFPGSSGTFDLKVNGMIVGTVPYSATATTTTISGINVPYDVIITLDNNSTPSNRVAFDDLSWTCYDCPSPAADPTGTIAGDTPECDSTELTYSLPSATTFWQTTADGHSTANPTTTPLEATTSGTYYVNTFDGTCWSINSVAYAVVINYSPVITTQPVNAVASVGDTVTFTVVATNATSYQWQESADGIVWTNVGPNSNTYTQNNIQLSKNGYKYRVIISSGTCGVLVSDIVTLNVYDSNCINEVFADTALPVGWGGNSTNDTGATHYLSGPNCRALALNRNIITPAVDNPEVLQFYQDASASGEGQIATVEYRIGAGAYVPFYSFAVTQAGNTETLDLTNAAGVDLSSNTNVTFRFRSTFNTWYLDDVKVFCTPCTNPTTVATALPSSGPEGTYVTINGSDFTASTVVKFNGISATIDSWTPNQLVVIVPAGATDGDIVISTVGVCDSAIAFDVIDKDDSACQSTFNGTDLFIYEIFDEDNNANGPPVDYGNGGMITILNPTLQTVNLNNYRIYRTGTVGSLPYSVWFSPSGTLAPGELYRIRVSASECTGYVTPYDDVVIGFNADDGFELRKFDTTTSAYVSIDQALTPNYVGYYMLRNLSASNPSTTYNASDWTITDIYNPPANTTTCVPVGVTPTFDGGLPIINSFFTTSNVCDTASITIDASEGYNETSPADTKQLNFEWYYFDGVTNVWTQITSGGDYLITNTINDVTGVGTSTLDVDNVYNKVDYQFYCSVREDNNTCYVASDAIKLDIAQTIWRSGVWNPAPPDINTIAVIDDNYDTGVNAGGQTSFSACQLIINAPYTLNVDNSTYVEVENFATVDGNLIVQTHGSFVQRADFNNGFVLNSGGSAMVNKSTSVINNWYDYTYWSSPVFGTTVGAAIDIAPANRRFWYDAANYLDVTMETNNDNGTVPGHDDIDDAAPFDWQVAPAGMIMAPGQGFAATVLNSGMFPGTRQITFDGPYNTGTITTPIFYNGPNGDNDWNLIGNPYPGALSFNDLYDANTAFIDGAAYLWSHSTIPPSNTNNGNEAQNFRDDYAIINRFVGNVAGGSGVTPDPGNYIPSGQSFFVKGLSNGNVTFNNAMRVADESSNDQFFRSGMPQPNKLWMNLTSNNGVFSQLLVGYVDGATNGEDGMAYDTQRNLSSGVMSALYTLIDGVDEKKYAIQGKSISSLNLDETIPLGFYTSITEPTTYKLSIADLQGEFFNSNTIYLKDNLLNVTYNLSSSDYIFSSQSGEFNNRFEIVFRDQALSVIDNEIPASGLSIIELPNGQVKFNVGNGLDILSVEIIDMLGRTLYNLKGNSPSEVYELTGLSQAAYMAKVTLSNGQVITKRAVKRY